MGNATIAGAAFAAIGANEAGGNAKEIARCVKL